MAAPTTSERILVYTAESADGLSPEWMCPLNTPFVLDTFNNALLPKDRMMNASLAVLIATLLRTLNVRIVSVERLKNKMLEAKTKAALEHWEQHANFDRTCVEFTWHGTHPNASDNIAENGARTGNNNIWGTGVNCGWIVEALRYLRIGVIVQGVRTLMHIFGCTLYTGAHMAVGSNGQMNFGKNANGQPITCLTNNTASILIPVDNSFLQLDSLCMVEWAGYETLTDESVQNLDPSNWFAQTDIDRHKSPFEVAKRAAAAKAAAKAAEKAAAKAAEKAAAKAAETKAKEAAKAKADAEAKEANAARRSPSPAAGGAAAGGLPMFRDVPPTASAARHILDAVKPKRRSKGVGWPCDDKNKRDKKARKRKGGAARSQSPPRSPSPGSPVAVLQPAWSSSNGRSGRTGGAGASGAAGGSAAGRKVPVHVPLSSPVFPYTCDECGVTVDMTTQDPTIECGRLLFWSNDKNNKCCVCDENDIRNADGEICDFCESRLKAAAKGKAAQGGSMAKGGRAAGGAGGAGGAARGPASAKAPLPVKDAYTCVTPGCFRLNNNDKPNCCLGCCVGAPLHSRHSKECQAIEDSRNASLGYWPAVVPQAAGNVISVGSSPIADADADDDDPNAAGPRMPRGK